MSKKVIVSYPIAMQETDAKPSKITRKNIFHLKANTCIIKALSFDECYDETNGTLNNLFACLKKHRKNSLFWLTMKKIMVNLKL